MVQKVWRKLLFLKSSRSWRDSLAVKALAAVPENPGQVPSTHVEWLTHIHSSHPKKCFKRRKYKGRQEKRGHQEGRSFGLQSTRRHEKDDGGPLWPLGRGGWDDLWRGNPRRIPPTQRWPSVKKQTKYWTCQKPTSQKVRGLSSSLNRSTGFVLKVEREVVCAGKA